MFIWAIAGGHDGVLLLVLCVSVSCVCARKCATTKTQKVHTPHTSQIGSVSKQALRAERALHAHQALHDNQALSAKQAMHANWALCAKLALCANRQGMINGVLCAK